MILHHVENVWMIYTEYVICFHRSSYWYKNSVSVPQVFQNVPQIEVTKATIDDKVGIITTLSFIWTIMLIGKNMSLSLFNELSFILSGM